MALNLKKIKEWPYHFVAWDASPTAMFLGTFDCDNSYPAGGYPLDMVTPNYMREVYFVLFEHKNGYTFEFDRATNKIRVFQYDYPGAAAGPAVEVPAGTDLSALTGVGIAIFGLY